MATSSKRGQTCLETEFFVLFKIFLGKFVHKVEMSLFSHLTNSIERLHRIKQCMFEKLKNRPLLPKEGKLPLKHDFSTFCSSFLKILSWNIVVHSAIVINRSVSVRSKLWHKNILWNKCVKMSSGWYTSQQLPFYDILPRFCPFRHYRHIVVYFESYIIGNCPVMA